MGMLLYRRWKEQQRERESQPEPPVSDEKETEDLRVMTVKELREKAKESGLSGYSQMTKDELVKSLKG